MKYTKEIMEKACISAKSLAQVCRNLGLKHVEKTSKIPLENILKENIDYKSSLLKERLINAGIKESKCELCGYTKNLELHHINGNHYDNRLENLQILYPNWHVKTNNYRGRNSHKNYTPKIAERKNNKSHWCICKNCGKEFYSDRIDHTRKFCCRECYNEYLKKLRLGEVKNIQTHGNREFKKCDLSIESLKEQIESCTSIQQIAENLGSNRTTIRNSLKKYDLYDEFKLKYDFHAKVVIQYDMYGNKLKEFPSITDAAEFVGLTNTSGITKCCKGERRSAGGYFWRYKEWPKGSY